MPFSRHVCEHLLQTDKQSTARSSTFLGACRALNRGEVAFSPMPSVPMMMRQGPAVNLSLEGPSLAESGCAVSCPMRSADLSPECYETVEQEAERFAAR